MRKGKVEVGPLPQTKDAETMRRSQLNKKRRVPLSGLSSSAFPLSPPRPSLLNTRPSARRGILLLVVLSMLTLFLLIGTSFIMSANQYRRANKTLSDVPAPSENRLQQTDLLDEVLGQLVRDTTNKYSALRYHSLLRDMYGADGFFFELPELPADGTTVVNQLPIVGNQFYEVRLTFTTPPPLSTIDNYYNGLVWTATNGNAGGVSARIVRYRFDTATSEYIFHIMPPTESSVLPNPGDEVVINGRPFNGTGVGYNAFAGTGDARLSTMESVFDTASGSGIFRQIGLMPNSAMFETDTAVLSFDKGLTIAPDRKDYFLTASEKLSLTMEQQERLIALRGLSGLGGADESYDAVDFQNMALALMPVSPIETLMPNLEPPSPPDPLIFSRDNLPPQLGNMILPSFHRPALINYWANQVALEAEPNLLRKVLLRPNWHDHPDFTGSNPEYAAATSDNDKLLRMVYGPWDVDNDNDGRRDSVWVDFGAPVMMSPNGKLVKPLAAVLCLDMDGRLNLNAHGSLEHVKPISDQPTPQLLAGGVLSDTLPHGQGYGPAEISLEPVVSVDGTSFFQRLLEGVEANNASYLDADGNQFDRNWSGRYGLISNNDDDPGAGNAYDLLAQMKQQGVPRRGGLDQNAINQGFTLSDLLGLYATPPDLMGRYSLGLNALGQPVYEMLDPDDRDGDTILVDDVDLDQDTPYELDLSRTGPVAAGASANDGPFSLGELERLLRAYDADAGRLSPRLWELANGFRPAPVPPATSVVNVDDLNRWRTLLTTDSYDLPVPNVVVPEWMRDGIPDGVGGFVVGSDFKTVMNNREPVNLTFADLLEYRLREQGLTGAVLEREMSKLMAPELADGLKIDINRPLGNGRDDNGNGVDDNPGVDDDGDGMIDEADEVDEPGEVEFIGGEFAGVVGVVDEPGEVDPNTGVEAPYWTIDTLRTVAAVPAAANDFTNSTTGDFRDNIDRNGDGTIDPAERGDVDGGGLSSAELVNLHNFRRQMLARHLYVLAMTLVDPFDLNTDEGKAKARRLAQWAINVVDYRDPDNIMTAFEYDANPFDGWNVDGDHSMVTDIYGADNKFGGDVGTPDADIGGVVWGAERPELLITETLAWHDRRTFDGQRESVNSLDEPDDAAIEDGIGDVRSGEDMTFDQELRPQGAGFIELYNPWPAETAANADTHKVDLSGNDLGIDLARTHDGTQNGSPLWRMMVYRSGGIDKNPDDPDVTKRPVNLVWLEKRKPPLRLDQIALPINNKADRSVYFAGFDPAANVDRNGDGTFDWDGDDGVAYFNRIDFSNLADPGNRLVDSVRPGRYMVIGSGEDKGGGEYLAQFGLSQNRGILLRTDPLAANAVSVLDSTNSTVMDVAGFPVEASADDGTIIPKLFGDTHDSMVSVAIIDQAMPTRDYRDAARRFTFSEPAGGYPDTVPLHNSRSKVAAPGGWNRTLKKYMPVMDRPLDERRTFDPDFMIYDPDTHVSRGLRNTIKRALRANGNWVMSPTPLNDGETRLSLPDDNKGHRMIPGFSWVYLQRLANPLLPWNPEPMTPDGMANPKHIATLQVNPYLTLDGMGVNVTVFNGQSEDEKQWPAGVARDSSTYKTYSNTFATQTLASVQRGRVNDPTKDVGNYAVMQDLVIRGRPNRLTDPHSVLEPLQENLWSLEPIDYWRNKGGPDGFGYEAPDTGHRFEAIPDCTLGFLNEPFQNAAATTPDEQKVIPKTPFPWFAWNNRPYTSEGELLQVPAYSSAELPRAFGFASTATGLENYDKKTEKVRETSGEDFELDGPYPHLMNFFRVKMGIGADTNPNTVDDEGIAGLFRVLEYVEVPSRYVGTEKWTSPATFGNNDVTSVDDPRYLRQPPFNRISNYREPGRVNLNTIISGDVWEGGILNRELQDDTLPWDPIANPYLVKKLLNPALPYDPVTNPYNKFWQSGPTSPQLTDSRREYGAVGSSGLLLDSSIPTFFANPFRSANTGDLAPLTAMVRDGIQSTALRRSFAPGNPNPPPLFAADNVGAGNEFQDSERNAYFRYQPLTRLSQMTTTRSNVYAVWITIGFFEVEEAESRNDFATRNGFTGGVTAASDALYDRVYPEGYELGQEMGSETGDIRRQRQFAIVDRTIPVAFEPGVEHNVERAIPLRRRIE